MFASDDIIGLYKKMQEAGVTVGEMVQLPTGLVLILQIMMIITLL